MRQTIGLGLAVAVAGPLLAVGAPDRAAAATPAPGAARAAPRAAAGGSTATRGPGARQSAGSAPGCGLELVQRKRQALALQLHGLYRVYPAGGRWSGFRLSVGNRLAVPCRRIAPVVVFGARSRTLHPGDVQLQWWKAAGGWQPVGLLDEAGVLVGKVGPAAGSGLGPGGRVEVPLRLRFGRTAPGGQWLTMAVGLAPVRLGGRPVLLPAGVSEPHLFRVEYARPAQHRRRAAAHGRTRRSAAGAQAGPVNSVRTCSSSASVSPCARRNPAVLPWRAVTRSRNSDSRTGWTGREIRSTPNSSR